MREAFISKRFNADTYSVIDQANDIIHQYATQGYSLSLRQLYYQFVARDLIPNTQRSYKRLGSILSDARLAGLIDWSAIADRTRSPNTNPHWESPQDILNAAVNQYAIDKWEGADNYVEVWVEKDALIDIVQAEAARRDITSFACRGYVSQSSMYDASKRFILEREVKDKSCFLLHLGDHDPSGLDMTRDIQDRLQMFGASVMVRRLALNREQIDLYRPPPNPAKITDSRYESYRRLHGDDSWELDALNPNILTEIIRRGINPLLDPELFEDRMEMEESHKERMRELISQYEEE